MANWFSELGDLLTGGKQSEAAHASQQATNTMSGVKLPDIDSMKVELEQLVNQGVLRPEDAQVYLQQASSMNDISTDPRFNAAQMDALNSLQDLSAHGGMTTTDKANLNQIAADEASKQRGSREAILQNAQARGVGGSGLELLAQLQNQQDSATRQNQRDLDVAGQAQSRALQALQSAGSLSGQMQAQQFGQKAEVAKANDAISNFNTQNQNAIGQANTVAHNNAQASNLANAQRISDANVGTRNTQQMNNANLQQQNFQNQMQRAGGIANALSGQAQTANQAGSQNMGVLGSAVQAVGTAVSDKRLKEEIEPFDASKFLDSLTSYKYNYKNPQRDGVGTFAGPMAQDLEKTPEGASLVEETPEGKRVDYGKGFGTILAALTDVHNRVKDLEGK